MPRSLTPARSLASPLRAGAALLMLGASLAVGVVTTTAPAATAATADCLDTIYLTDGGGTPSGNVFRSSLGGVVDPTPVYDGAPNATSSSNAVNQLGIGPDRTFAINAVNGPPSYLVVRDFVANTTTPIAKPSSAEGRNIAGAVNPANGAYYFGGYNGQVLDLWVLPRGASAASAQAVANVTVPGAPGINGDLAFGSDGTLYFVSSSAGTSNLYTLEAELPTSGSAQPFTAKLLTSTTVSAASNGIAFASDGYLYLGAATTLQKVNPITGARVGTASTFSGATVSSTDLGTCATPNTIEAGVTLPDNRLDADDQFVTEVTGGTYTNQPNEPTFPSGTTEGSDSGPQNLPPETAGPGIVLPGETYTVSVTGDPNTNINDYTTRYTCTDADGTVTREGDGTSVDITPANGTGVAETCTFTVQNPVALTKTVSPTSFSKVGDELTYTFVAKNDDNAPLANFQLDDGMPGLGAVTCAPIAEGGTLPAGGSTTCTATYTVTGADVRSGSAKANTATMTTDPRVGSSRTSSATSAVTAANAAAPLVATDDSVGTPFNTPVTLPASANDTAGSTPVVATSTVFTASGATNNGKNLSTPQGEWEVLPDGRVRFTPAPGYAGTTPAVEYAVTDENGFTDTADLRVTVRPGPVAGDNAASTPQNVDVTVPVLGNDTPGTKADGTDGSFDPALVTFPTTGQPGTVSPDGRTLTVAGQGVYTIDPATGRVTFDPEPQLTGPAAPVTYRAVDQAGNAVTAQLAITVDGISPVANDDTASTPFNTAVVLEGVTDDTAGAASAPLVPGATVFTTTDQPAGATVSPDGKTLTVTGQGTWVVQGDGSVRFTPAPGYAGTTDAVTYRIEDVNGTRDTATLAVTVRPGPVAVDDTASTPQNVDVTVPVLGNDIPGKQANGADGSFDPALVTFPATGQPGTVSPDGRTLTVAGQGVYTIDPATGRVTFDPEPQFTGPAAPVTYRAVDQAGNAVTAQLAITVAGISPVANDDTAVTRYGVPVVLEGVTDDTAGAASAPLVPAATVFTTGGQPSGATVSPDGKTVAVPGQGSWVVLADGTVRFTPATGFSGATSPVTYRIEDSNGTTDTATLQVTVRPGPVAAADAASTPQNVTVTLDPLANDTTALDVDGTTRATWDRSSLVLVATPNLPAGSALSPDGKTLTVPGQGTWTVAADGTVSFDPLPQFTGVATPVGYEVTDSFGNVSGSTLTVSVDARTPRAIDDAATTPYRTTVVIDVLGNDLPATGVALDPASLRLVDPVTGQPVATVTVPGEGTWTVVDGTVRFTPADGFSGSPTPVAYVVADVNGTTTRASITVVVGAPGTVEAVQGTTTEGEPVTVDVVGGVTPPAGQTVDETTLCLLPGTSNGRQHPRGDDCVTEVTIPGQGTWEVNPDGTVTFSPVDGFTGVASIDFEVLDTAGNSYSDTISVTVKGDDKPGPRGGQHDPAEPQTAPEEALPDTGGVPFSLVVVSLLCLALGGGLVHRSRRRA